MDISSIGVKTAIGTGSAAAVATPATLGAVYKDEIAKFMGIGETPSLTASEEAKRINSKLKDLGIPDKCNFADGDSFKNCDNLALEDIKTVNFSDKGDSENLSMEVAGTISLKIEKVEDKSAFPEGLRFTFTAAQELRINPTPEEGRIFLTKDKPVQFKIKVKDGKSKLEEVSIGEAELTKLNDKITSLSIPDGKCRFTASGTPVECRLDAAELKAMKFVGEAESNAQPNKQIRLRIERVDGGGFPENLKFIFFSSEANAVEYGNEPNRISVKDGESDEFKIKVVGDENKLEKIWTVAKLGEKVGLTCTTSESNNDCVYKAGGKINVWKDGSSKIIDATGISGNSKLTFLADPNSNHGFKFNAAQAITLTVSSGNSQMEAGDYEIKYQSDKKWYLTKK